MRHKDRKFIVLYFCVIFSFVCIGIRLFYMQVVCCEQYMLKSVNADFAGFSKNAPRGKIYDRYGNLLVSDCEVYSVIATKEAFKDTSALLKVYNLLVDDGYIEAEDLLSGINNFSNNQSVVIAQNVSVDVALKIKESDILGIDIKKSYVRKYHNDGLASHIIGYTGKINNEEYKVFKNQGYLYNDVIGKQGVEKLAEQYLRAKDAFGGNDINLTIDMQMQSVVEKSLENTIKQISSQGGEKSGIDANSGAAVVIDVHSGDILACASYPTYNLSDFNKNYTSLASDTDLPLWNRAIGGVYSPGSVFKPIVAIAALRAGKISADEKITDKGVYDAYSDYKPRCWLWSESGLTHGDVNVTEAIEQSCNYYFYEAGIRTGINDVSRCAAEFGFGSLAGTGLLGEAKGQVANPESKKKSFSGLTNQNWYAADTLQASIGQSVNAFTPLQMANYIATIANGGTRYKLNIIKSVRSAKDVSLVYKTKPSSETIIKIDPENLNAVRLGLKNVVEEGSARGIFAGYTISVGGKTGTAQVGGNGSNNALFVAFAPFDEPEIAICVVIEHGVRGANAAVVAKDLFDYYFELN